MDIDRGQGHCDPSTANNTCMTVPVLCVSVPSAQLVPCGREKLQAQGTFLEDRGSGHVNLASNRPALRFNPFSWEGSQSLSH